MKNKFLVIIYTHKKTFSRRKFLLEYYVNNLGCPVYFITGDKDIKHDNVLHIDFNESYDQLGLKTYLAFKQISKLKFNYLIKLNDDTLLNLDRFLKVDISKYHYIGKMESKGRESSTSHYFKCSNPFKLPKASNETEYMEGGFVVLSRKAFKKIINTPKEHFINTPGNYSGEDQKIGEILQREKKLNLNSKYSKYLNMDITENGISLHPIHESLTKLLINKSFEEQLDVLCKNSHKNEYNLLDSLRNNISRAHCIN